MHRSFYRAALALILAPAPGARAAQPWAATLTTEQRELTADGLERQVRFRERFVRLPDRVWLERLLPTGPAFPEAPHGGHRHLDLDQAARLVVRRPDGSLDLTFVHRGERTTVHAEPRDYPEVGFHDSWEVVAHLVDPATLKAMASGARSREYPGATWYERRDGAGFLRVLWHPGLEVALVVESGSADGRRYHRTSATPEALPTPLPWRALQGYREKDYTDLLD